MTDAELNRRIAKALGWTVMHNYITGWFLQPPGRSPGQPFAKTEEEAWGEAPDYAHDGNAMLELLGAVEVHNIDMRRWVRGEWRVSFGGSDYKYDKSLPRAVALAALAVLENTQGGDGES